MLAGIEKAFRARTSDRIKEEMSAMDSLVSGLIDYAGLYPPAALGMCRAVRNYLSYEKGKRAASLGRFIVDLNRLAELGDEADESLREFRLSVIAPVNDELDNLRLRLDAGFPIDAVEVKADRTTEIERIRKCIPVNLKIYFEVPAHGGSRDLLDAIAAAGAGAKVRMGGVVAESFPLTATVADLLKALADRHIPFKATAGLHHPVRSRHPFTSAADSPGGTMHGFINLCCAAALIHFGGDKREAELLLNEEDPDAWEVTPEAIGWGSFKWNGEQLSEVRQQFLISFGSCSFAEPVHDLETLGWL